MDDNSDLESDSERNTSPSPNTPSVRPSTVLEFHPIILDNNTNAPLSSSSQTDPDQGIKSEILDILEELEYIIDQTEKYKNPNEGAKTTDNSRIDVEYSSINVDRDKEGEEEDEETDITETEIVLV
jgi:hypothetical protein